MSTTICSLITCNSKDPNNISKILTQTQVSNAPFYILLLKQQQQQQKIFLTLKTLKEFIKSSSINLRQNSELMLSFYLFVC